MQADMDRQHKADIAKQGFEAKAKQLKSAKVGVSTGTGLNPGGRK